MSYKIFSTKEFEKDFRKLNPDLKSRIKKKFLEVSENPERYKHMHHPLEEYCRIRIRKLRILFSYDSAKEIIYLEKIVFGHNY